jgi:hypothetical protein
VTLVAAGQPELLHEFLLFRELGVILIRTMMSSKIGSRFMRETTAEAAKAH